MGYNTYGLTSSYSSGPSMGTGALVWMIISFVAALIGCFVVYFIFVNKKGTPKQGFLAWLKSFLAFDKMLIEPMLKICYIFVAILITLGSFSFIGTSFFMFLGILVGGNLGARLLYEAALMKVMIWKNTTEIKNHLK